MTSVAFFLILTSSVLHATWHFICKQHKPYVPFYLVLSLGALLATSPLFLLANVQFSALPYQCWIALFVAGVSGCLTNASLAAAYRSANLSLIYPLSRALPILLTACVTEFIYLCFGSGTALSVASLFALLVIFVGCVFMPLKSFSDFKHLNSNTERLVYLWLLLTVIGITGYTVADKYGIDYLLKYGAPRNKILGSCAYAFLRECFLFITMFIYILCNRHERRHLTGETFKTSSAYLAGIIATTAYIMVLGAMHFVTNVCYVQAFRQISLPIGVLLGIIFLKERMPLPRILGMVILVTGLAMLAFAS